MDIVIDRDRPDPRQVGGCVFFQGRDEAGSAVTVKLDTSAWDTVQTEWSYDPLAGVEVLARNGHWRMFGDELVWRVDLV